MESINLIFVTIMIIGVPITVSLLLSKRKHTNEARLQEQKKVDAFSDLNKHLYNRASNYTNVNRIISSADELQRELNAVRNLNTPSANEEYESNISHLRSNAANIIVEKWEKAIDPILDEFYDLYELIIDADFSDVENALVSAKPCMAAFDKYWKKTDEYAQKYAVPLSAKGITLRKEAMKYLNDAMHDREFPDFWNYTANTSHALRDELSSRLVIHVSSLQSEYERKMQTCNDLVDYIKTEGSVLRADLLRHSFANVTNDELLYCFDLLLSQGRINCIKQNNRYVVSIRDDHHTPSKQKNSSSASKQKSAANTSTSQKKKASDSSSQTSSTSNAGPAPNMNWPVWPWPEADYDSPALLKRIFETHIEKWNDDCSAIFIGKNGTYRTSYDQCQCGSFIRYRKPCKHMLRLAHETGAIHLTMQSERAEKTEQTNETHKQHDAERKSDKTTADQPRDIFDILKENNIRYVDKTASGGCLWILISHADSPVIEMIRSTNQYSLRYVPTGSKASKHEPAWYVKLNR